MIAIVVAAWLSGTVAGTLYNVYHSNINGTRRIPGGLTAFNLLAYNRYSVASKYRHRSCDTCASIPYKLETTYFQRAENRFNNTFITGSLQVWLTLFERQYPSNLFLSGLISSCVRFATVLDNRTLPIRQTLSPPFRFTPSPDIHRVGHVFEIPQYSKLPT